MPYRRLPSLLALRAFESVARNGSMKKAAEELNVTPGAISQLVRKLEEELDCRLLIRLNRRFELTEPGIRLKTGLADAFIRMKAAVESVTPLPSSKGLLVACGPPFAAKWLVPRLSDFLEKHPDIEIRIASDYIKEDYDAREVDIGIRLSENQDASLERLWLGEETMMVLGAPKFIEQQKIKEPKDVLRVPLLSEENSERVLNAPSWRTWFSEAGLPEGSANRGVNFGNHVEQAIDAAVTGAGVVLAPKVLAAGDIEAGRLVCPFGPVLNMGVRYQVVCRKEIQHTEQAIVFRTWLVAELEKSLNLCPLV